MKEDKTIQATDISHIGEVQIADEVIAIIACLAATEVEGVYGMSGNFTGEIVEKLGKKNLSKGVRVQVGEANVSVEIYLIISFGYKIPEISQNVQEKVKSAIETMTGLSVVEVNLHITGIHIDKQTQKQQEIELDLHVNE